MTPLPPSAGDRVEARTRALLQLPSSGAVDTDDAGRVLIRSDATGTFQLSELDRRSGAAPATGTPPLRPLTALREAVTGFYLPGARRMVIAVDSGGDERPQLYLVDLDAPALRDLSAATALTSDGRYAHIPAGVSPDGTLVAFVSNRRNGVDFDVWIADLRRGEQRCVYDGGGWCAPASGFSPDGAVLSAIRPGPRPLDQDLLLIDVASGSVRVVDAHPDEAAMVGPPAWLDTATFVAASSVGRDHAAVVRFDVGGGRDVVMAGEWDLGVWADRAGTTLLAVINEDGATRAVFVDPATGEQHGELPVPEPGVVAMAHNHPPPLLGADGAVTYTFTSPTRPMGVWHFDRATATTRPLTAPVGDREGLVSPQRLRLRSFDGEELSVALYRPAPQVDGGPPDPAPPPSPVMLSIHGGPESQSMLRFSPLVQAAVAAGVAVVVPNVRGSTGYGKRFASLDDTTRRLDSVADLAAIHDWLPEVGLDPARAGLQGGSYGGYMVLAGCAFQPQRWAVGVDEVGMSDLTTFLRNTADYRRAQRELEYGSLAHDSAFLRSASPLGRVDDIRAPLFVIHGANDPRVPLAEAEQLVASLRRRGVACELAVYPDEGHGLTKLHNRLDAYPRAIGFLASSLGVRGSPPA
jgi:dipeptidyl aminopeptidase/acylaminoacyl peptidase